MDLLKRGKKSIDLHCAIFPLTFVTVSLIPAVTEFIHRDKLTYWYPSNQAPYIYPTLNGSGRLFLATSVTEFASRVIVVVRDNKPYEPRPI